LSVALVTRDRPESLARCLESLRGQSVQPGEVVVSDDSASAAAATREVAERFGCLYRKGPARGLYANRNAAALACSGTHIRTADDDHTFPEGHFARCLDALRSDPDAIWTTGEICFVEGRYFGRYERASQLHPAGVGAAVSDPGDNWAIADGSTHYPREVFASGHRMEEAFGYGAAYLEFGAFLYRRGFRSRCVEGALVEHHADNATLSRGACRSESESRIWASICFNRFFRPGAARLARYLVANLWAGRNDRALAASIPRLWAMAGDRWSGSGRETRGSGR
jgi:glycosyltransferase involved in cell wall biosynthesis